MVPHEVPAAPTALVRRSSAARALNLIGDRWTLLVLYAAFMGVKRFDDFVAMIEALQPNPRLRRRG